MNITPSMFTSVAVQTLGGVSKLIVGGTGITPGQAGAFMVSRYLGDGTLDPTFGTDGVVSHYWGMTNGNLAVAVQTDGKIIVAGNGYDNAGTIPKHLQLIRYTVDGEVDTTFGRNGMTSVQVGGEPQAVKILLQSTGKIVVAGVTPGTSVLDLMLLRVTADGALDPTFGDGSGSVTLAYAGDITYVNDAALDPVNDLIYVASDSYAGSKALITRFTADGVLDTSFNATGSLELPGFEQNLPVLHVQSDHRFVVGGIAKNWTGYRIARFSPAGVLENTFGTAGNMDLALPANQPQPGTTSLQQLGDGSYLLSTAIGGDLAVIKFGSTGLDTTFGSPNGYVKGPSGQCSLLDGVGCETSMGMAVLPGGRIVIIGYTQTGFNGMVPVYFPTLAAFSAAGAVDTTLNPSGTPPGVKLVTDPGQFGTPETNPKIARQSSGKMIVAVNTINDANVSTITVIRRNSDGSLDTGFGTSGKTVVNLELSQTVNALAIDSLDRIIIAGQVTDTDLGIAQAAVLRLTSAGAVDTSFNTTGVYEFGGQNSVANGVAVQSDNRILAVGAANDSGTTNALVARVTTAGAADAAFGGTGVLVQGLGTGTYAAGSAVAIQADGKIVLAGVYSKDTGAGPLLMRLKADGSLDNTFGASGLALLSMGDQHSSSAAAIAIQSDGKIVVGGYVWNGTDDNYFVVARVSPSGSLDNSFGTGGVAMQLIDPTGNAFGNALVNGVAIDSQGRILATGYSTVATAGQHTATVVRFTTLGAVDPAFGSNGIHLASFGAAEFASEGTGMALESDESLLICGTSLPVAGTGLPDLGLMRYKF